MMTLANITARASLGNLTLCHSDEIGAAVNYVMSRDSAARARYLAIYGEEWSPLGNGDEINDGVTSTDVTAVRQ